VKAIRSQDVS